MWVDYLLFSPVAACSISRGHITSHHSRIVSRHAAGVVIAIGPTNAAIPKAPTIATNA
jgi:hypothetical protein